MELLKNLELVEAAENNNTLTLTFLDEEHGEIREVLFHKDKFDKDKNSWIKNDEQAKWANEKVQEYLGTSFENAVNAVGQKHDVYVYDRFNSLWESTSAEKFEKDEIGQIFQTVIDEVVDDGIAILTKFKWNDKNYQSKLTYAKYMETMKKWFVDPQKKTKQYQKFEKKYNVPVESALAGDLNGKTIMVEVKSAFGYPYADVKNLPKTNK